MKVDLKFCIEVPDGTDPQRVLEVVQHELDDATDGGGLCQWGEWTPGPAELLSNRSVANTVHFAGPGGGQGASGSTGGPGTASTPLTGRGGAGGCGPMPGGATGGPGWGGGE